MSGELDALALAVESLDLSVDTEVLAEVLAIAGRLQVKLARAASEVDDAELWKLGGARSVVRSSPPADTNETPNPSADGR